ncbi:pyruvate oxidase [Paenibacillus sp. J31TS4]|uniref:thiamine pyrophosphate-binding protein n=1 Tax=Paenibacillus sp. J31TS4 TaxID=2807195 RepID=UPI001B0366D4|nr:thiamine pyrophosphate-binding protein [Paenibacillus sp. J31TS4]GIP37092.1 pyruvate oxidase [Paenibacillus sp. J31TS4]
MMSSKPKNSAAPVPVPKLPASATVADVILEQLRLWGVQRIYGVVGDAIFGLLDALAKQEAISFIAVKHESVAAMMASAEAKLTGRLAVCASQMGPGLANLINGLGDAYLDNAPVLAITGQAPLAKIGTSYKQFIHQQQLVGPVSSSSELVVHPEAVVDSLTQAMSTSLLQQTVTHLSIPQDVFLQTAAGPPRAQPMMPVPCAAPDAVLQAVQIMQSAKRPVMLVGSRVRVDSDVLQAMADAWGCAIVMSYGAIGLVPDSHPSLLHGLGEGGNPHLDALFPQADVVLAIETSWWPKSLAPANARIIQLAKRPGSIGGSVPADLAIVGEAAALLPDWLEEMKQSYKPNPAWLEQIRKCKQAWSVQRESECRPSASPLAPARIIKSLEQSIASDAVIALDEGNSTLWFLRSFRASSQRIVLSEHWRTMGFGLPAAMAAKLCFPNKQVVCITGDGGLGMVLADLLTAARYRLPILVVVFNNGALQMERDKMIKKGLQPEGTELTNPDFAKVAEGCGWTSFRVETLDQLEQALARWSSGGEPILLDVATASIPHPDFTNEREEQLHNG